MYSYEDRMRAVELYIKYEHSAADVIRELGYPKSGATLAAWVDEPAPGQRREVRSGGSCAHSYEDKVDAVVALETRDQPGAALVI